MTTTDHVLVAVAVVLTMAVLALALSVRRLFGELDDVDAAVGLASRLLRDRERRIAAARVVAAPTLLLRPGGVPPEITLQRPMGETIRLESRLDGRPLLLVFIAAGGAIGAAATERVRTWNRTLRGTVDVIGVVAADADHELDTERFADDDGDMWFRDIDGAAERFGAAWLPAAIAVGPDVRLLSDMRFGIDDIQQLVERVAGTPHDLGPSSASWRRRERRIQPGRELPDFDLVDVEGRRVTNTDLVGRESLLVFWDVDCGYCADAEAALAGALTTGRRASQLSCWVISRDGRALDLSFPARVVLDRDRVLENALELGHTPSAFLVGTDGGIRSGIAVGAREMLVLVGVDRPAGPVRSMAVHVSPR